jgi:hypothetical protein
MLALDEPYNLLADPLYQMLQVHEDRKLMFFRRGPLVFGFNFPPDRFVVGSPFWRPGSGQLSHGSKHRRRRVWRL